MQRRASFGEDEVVNGGTLTGPGLLHVVLSKAESSNAKLDEMNSDMPSGTSSVHEGKRTTSLYATVSSTVGGFDQRAITITIMGGLKAGAKFEMVFLPYELVPGKGYVQLMQNTNSWRAESGTITIDAVKDDAVKISSTVLPMAVATVNAPGNAATGTFEAKLDAQVLAISGLE